MHRLLLSIRLLQWFIKNRRSCTGRAMGIGIATTVGTVIANMTTGGIGDGTTITNIAITITVTTDLSARHGV
jgi:hypothetical protein